MLKMKASIRKTLLLIILVSSAVFFLPGPGALGKTSGGPALLLEKADQCRKGLYRSKKKQKYRQACLLSYFPFSKEFTPIILRAIRQRGRFTSRPGSLPRFTPTQGDREILMRQLGFTDKWLINTRITVLQMMHSI